MDSAVYVYVITTLKNIETKSMKPFIKENLCLKSAFFVKNLLSPMKMTALKNVLKKLNIGDMIQKTILNYVYMEKLFMNIEHAEIY